MSRKRNISSSSNDRYSMVRSNAVTAVEVGNVEDNDDDDDDINEGDDEVDDKDGASGSGDHG
jgi:hypothetical protein